MALEIHNERKRRLREAIVSYIRNARVMNGKFLEFDSIKEILDSETILPRTGNVRKKLTQYISDVPLFDFLYGYINRDLDIHGKFREEQDAVSLSEFKDYSNPEEAADRLIGEFLSLPWRYNVSFAVNPKIGETIKAHIGNYGKSDNIRLVVPDDRFVETFPLTKRGHSLSHLDFMAYLFGESPSWNPETAYLQIIVDGFISQNFETTPIVEVISKIKAFFGLGIAVNLFQIDKRNREWIDDAHRLRPFIVHRRVDDQWLEWAIYAPRKETFGPLDSIVMSETKYDSRNDGFSRVLRSGFKYVLEILMAADEHPRLILASQWLLDSYIGKNELLSFLQATVAIEILLGDDEHSEFIGIGELLRNRCAYLIAKNREERTFILDLFKKIYKCRSSIVHRGKPRLSRQERALLSSLQLLCRRVIFAEMGLYFKGIEN